MENLEFVLSVISFGSEPSTKLVELNGKLSLDTRMGNRYLYLVDRNHYPNDILLPECCYYNFSLERIKLHYSLVKLLQQTMKTY